MAKRISGFSKYGLILVLVGILVVVPFLKRSFPGVFYEGFMTEEQKAKYREWLKQFTKEDNAPCRDENDCKSRDCQGVDKENKQLGKCKAIPPGGQGLRSKGMACYNDVDCIGKGSQTGLSCVQKSGTVGGKLKILDGICVPTNTAINPGKGYNLDFNTASSVFGPIRR